MWLSGRQAGRELLELILILLKLNLSIPRHFSIAWYNTRRYLCIKWVKYLETDICSVNDGSCLQKLHSCREKQYANWNKCQLFTTFSCHWGGEMNLTFWMYFYYLKELRCSSVRWFIQRQINTPREAFIIEYTCLKLHSVIQASFGINKLTAVHIGSFQKLKF